MGMKDDDGGPVTDYAEASTPPSESKGAKALDDAISAAMTGHDGREPDPAEEAPAEPAGEGEAGDTEIAAEPGPDEPVQDDSAEAQTKPDGQSGSDAPQHWNKDWRDDYAKTDEAGRRLASAVDKEWARGYQQKMQEFHGDRRYAESVRGSIPDSVREQLRANGLTEAQFVGDMARWYVALSQNPREAYEELGRQLRLSEAPGTPSNQGQAGQPEADEWQDPEIQGLRSELGTLRQGQEKSQQTVEQLHQQLQNMTRQQQIAAADSHIQQFAAETDEAGHPKHPYFDQLQKHIVAIMRTDPEISAMPLSREKLAAAYEQAVEPFLEQLRIAEQHQRETQEKQAHAAKVRAAATPKPRPGSSVPASEKPRDLDDIIKAARAQAGG